MQKTEKLNVSPFTVHQSTTVRRVSTAGLVAGGFTIIEVMIVLAIAALILLVVFLAVPALQRNQRNSARKTDAARMATAVIDFSASNGALPATVANCATLIDATTSLSQYTFATADSVVAGPPRACGAAFVNATANATVAAPTNGTFTIYTNANNTQAYPAITSANSGMVLVENTASGAQCASTGGSTLQAGNSIKSAALMYVLESGGTSATWACLNPQ